MDLENDGNDNIRFYSRLETDFFCLSNILCEHTYVFLLYMMIGYISADKVNFYVDVL